jgi:hypothetical protein
MAKIQKVREAKHDALMALWRVYLHMRAWGLPEYDQLPAEERGDFLQHVKQGTLFDYVEECKLAVCGADVAVKDSWLLPLFAGDIGERRYLPEARREELGRITTDMYPVLVRLEASLKHPPFIRSIAPPTVRQRQGGAGNGLTQLTNTTNDIEQQARSAAAPKWNSERRELSLRGQVVKTYRQPAPNQIALLEAFQVAGWPQRIDDPLPFTEDGDARQRLADAVASLNKTSGIQFERDGAGHVLWKPL